MARYSKLFAALALSGLTAVFALVSTASADELQDIGKLLRAGQHAQALERVNRYLASRPGDAQGRFLRGLVLAEQNRTSEAIDAFTRLTQDYPDLPEPYNNLAVLFAAQGQYERARQALEQSIRTHPSYATAYENLGDVYAKLASQAYDKALQLDSANTNAQTKLALLRDLTAGPRGAAAKAAPVRAQERSGSAPAVLAQAPAKPAAAAQASAGATLDAKAAAKAEATAAAKVQARAPEPAVPKAPESATRAGQPAPKARGSDAGETQSEAVVRTVNEWVRAWESRDVNAYLAFYAKDFKPQAGESRADWEAGRRKRILAPKEIAISADRYKVSFSGENSASVSFRQNYRSELVKSVNTKTLVLARRDGIWLIQQEKAGP
ncbi:MAG: tetratricopeptide repeat protein [Burkholderiales bacterium]|nr:tetratricopeptide repeat protein [Burkholderiales bacterium]